MRCRDRVPVGQSDAAAHLAACTLGRTETFSFEPSIAEDDIDGDGRSGERADGSLCIPWIVADEPSIVFSERFIVTIASRRISFCESDIRAICGWKSCWFSCCRLDNRSSWS